MQWQLVAVVEQRSIINAIRIGLIAPGFISRRRAEATCNFYSLDEGTGTCA